MLGYEHRVQIWSRPLGSQPNGGIRDFFEYVHKYKFTLHLLTYSHISGSRLPLLSARPAVTFPATERHRPLAGTKLYCLVTEAHGCEQLAQSCCQAAKQPGVELMTSCPNHWATKSQVKNASPSKYITRNTTAEWCNCKLWHSDEGDGGRQTDQSHRILLTHYFFLPQGVGSILISRP